ncbi:glutamyl-tRNA(Gln) amidotransferase subunit [Pichia kluyveri]|uniref:Glutamyl-tRNA(Gln) amidotransferase subunit B, mitochondrial n=1 Tax=Pichia kluyveri TaxID=36015 RepID=A0AAV5R8Z5_PICKL|nr:glutamyl-tRNA(Gln) amidotransferase subunit [Pichia kluyveri]
MFKVGLEIHTQLHTSKKLFSKSSIPSFISNNTFDDNTSNNNKNVSFQDLALPGTQPILTPNSLNYAIKLALSLNCKINKFSNFDRKHYFYGDQPLGYQITQHYNPIASNGQIKLFKRHNPKLSKDLLINIIQLQLEQDTGRSIYHSINSSNSFIDFNRSNISLIEMVTEPNFTNIEEIRSFLQYYIKLIQNLNISSGDLENGSIRVDVNINIPNHPRVEIKNLPTISSILNACKYESNRQYNILKEGLPIDNSIQTRGWDGKKTFHLRNKESNVDYRYVPDMELPILKISSDLINKIEKFEMPISTADKLDYLMNNYNLNIKDARILFNNDKLLNFYEICYKNSNDDPKSQKKLINWINHELLGSLTKSELEFNENIINVESFIELIKLVNNNKITNQNGKLLLLHLINNKDDQLKSIESLAIEFDMIITSQSIDNSTSIIIDNILNKYNDIVIEIKSTKPNKINYLLGQCMKELRGKVQPNIIMNELKKRLDI